MHFVNREYASGTYHTLEGILMMGFGLFLLNSVCSLFNQFCPNRRDQDPGDPFKDASGTVTIIVPVASRTSHIERASRLEKRGNHGKPGPSSRTQGSIMTQMHRCLFCAGILMIGLAAQGELKRLNQTERPSLRRDLESIPLELGDWVGQKEDVAPDIVERAQTTEYLNRVYESRTQPGLRLTLWINYSEKGTNLRHTPEICLPSGGWTKIESQTKVLSVLTPGTTRRCGLPVWATAEVNWLNRWDSGITFSERASWRTLSGNCRSPAGAATDRPRVARR